MLILTRKTGETVVVGENADVRITVLSVRGDQVRLGFDADQNISVHREEIYQKIQRDKRNQGSNNESLLDNRAE